METMAARPDAPQSLLVVEPSHYLQLRKSAVRNGEHEPKHVWDPRFEELGTVDNLYRWHLRKEGVLLGPFEHRPMRMLDAFDVIDEEFSVVPSLVWSTSQLQSAVTNDGHIFDAVVCTDVPDVDVALGLLDSIAKTIRERIQAYLVDKKDSGAKSKEEKEKEEQEKKKKDKDKKQDGNDKGLGTPQAPAKRLGRRRVVGDSARGEGGDAETRVFELGTMNIANAGGKDDGSGAQGGSTPVKGAMGSRMAAPLELGLMLPRMVIVLTEDATPEDAAEMQRQIDRSHRGVQVLPLRTHAARFYSSVLVPAFGRSARWQRLSMGKAQGMLGGSR